MAEVERAPWWRGGARALGRGQGAVGLSILLTLGVAALVGPWARSWATGSDYAAQDLNLGPVPPCWAHPFGTDYFGRDQLLRCLCGLQLSMAIGASAAVVSVSIGLLYGSVAGYLGGRWDAMMMRAVDVLYALPFVFLVIVLTCVLGRSTLLLFVGLGAVSWLTCARVVRTEVMRLRQGDFVAALEVMGASTARILLAHIVPNTLSTVLVMFSLSVPSMVLEEAFLSFLGLGVQAPAASLGALMGDGAAQMLLFWWLLLFPAAIMAALLLGLNLLSDALASALRPRAGP